MATSPEPQYTQDNPAVVASSARFLFGGLVWGALMLLTLGFWLRAKYDAGSLIWANIVLASGVAVAFLAAWQAFTLWIQNLPVGEKTAALLQQRRLFSLIFMAGGFALLVLALVLGMGKKPSGVGFIIDNLGESLSLLVFALATLGAGFALSSSNEQGGGGFIQIVKRSTPMLRIVSIALAIAINSVLAYFYFRHGQPFFFTWLPELLGLFLLSILFVSCFFWLNTGSFDDVGTRLLVLVVGGTSGLIVFLHTLGRVYLWRDDIFLGGVEAWQGDQAWRFWLCSYILFASLVLVFASLYAAQADIRQNVILRRLIYGFTTIAQGLLLAGILFVFMVVVYTHYPLSFDLTNTRGAYDLSVSSKNLLKNLKEETNIYVLLSQGEPVFKDTRNLLDNCQAISNHKLKVEYISPDLSPKEYLSLAKKFPQLLPDPRTGGGRGILIVYGPMPKDDKHKTPHAFVPVRKLEDLDEEAAQRGGRMKKVYKGEGEIIKELKFLAQDQKKRKIYFLQGDEELNSSSKNFAQRRSVLDSFGAVGIGHWADSLKKENYDVFGLTFQEELPGQKNPGLIHAVAEGTEKKKEIPDDCHLLVIAGASRAISAEALTAVERYMDRGSRSKLLVFLDVMIERDYSKMKKVGLDDFLKRYGVEVTSDFIMQAPKFRGDDPFSLIARPSKETQNPLATAFERAPLYMENSARVVRPAEAAGGRFKAETIWTIDPTDHLILVEKDGRAINDLGAYFKELQGDRKKLMEVRSGVPVSVGVAVSETKGEKPRMVVMGDAEFLSNVEWAQSDTREINRAFGLSALEWLAERESIGAQPRVTSVYNLPGGGANVDRFLPFWVMLLTLLTLGAGIWIVRRR